MAGGAYWGPPVSSSGFLPWDLADAENWRRPRYYNSAIPPAERHSRKGSRICFKIKTRYTDGGIGESYWKKHSLYARRTIENLVFVKCKGKYRFSGVLDEDGCTQRFKNVPEGEWVQVDVLSAGYVGRWLIQSWAIGSDKIPRNKLALRLDDKNKTYRHTLSYSNSRNVYMAVAKALTRNPVSFGKSDAKIRIHSRRLHRHVLQQETRLDSNLQPAEVYEKTVEIAEDYDDSKRWKRAARANGVDW